MFNKLSIAQRLGAGFAVMIAVAMGIAALSIVDTRRMSTAITQEAEGLTKLLLVTEWQGQTQLNLTRTLVLARSSDNPALKAELGPQMKATSARISELQKKIEAAGLDAEMQALYDKIAAARKTYISTRDDVFKAVDAGDTSAVKRVETELQPMAAGYLGAIVALTDKLKEHAAEHRQEAIADGEASQTAAIGALVVALVVGLFMSWRTTRAVTAPVRSLAREAEVMASGDLSKPMQVDRQDELGELQQALERMRVNLQSVVSSIRQSTDGITTASSEIAAGSQDLSGRTEQTASNLQQAASSMSQLNGTVRATAESATTANQLAATAAETARRGGEVVSEVVGNMRDISDSSRKIADIIGVIDGIAFQTNILALNAAVEAARAGEQGRGFAVVAGEVRSLAGRSAEAAREIKTLIGASVEKVESGVHLVESAGTTMTDIVSSVQRVTDIIAEITAATAEQSSGIASINGAVNHLDEMTQQNAALVEQSAAAAESLKSQAGRLAEVVRQFRLSEQASATSATALTPPPAPRAMATPAVHRPAVKPAIAPRKAGSLPTPTPVPKHQPSTDSSEGEWESF